jgi:hypothetical protein
VYLGNLDSGLSIFVRLANEEIFPLSQQGGDAGDAWDIRSQVTRNQDGTIAVERVTFTSEEEILPDGSNAPALCHAPRKLRFLWNPQKRDFEGSDIPTGDLGWIAPPINIAGACLDSAGRWKTQE